MHILIVPDSFKENLSATRVAAAIERGIKKVNPRINVHSIPFSDGGEGALTMLEKHLKGKRVSCKTVDPLGRHISADYFRFDDKKTAWIELSQAAGLALLKKEERSPCSCTTYGTGLQIKHAIDHGCTKIILGIGGSATNDGGAGIFQALGGQLLDKDLKELHPGGAALAKLHKIILPKGYKNIEWQLACDVENPLLGQLGATRVYGPQKGASAGDIALLEHSLTHYAHCIEKQLDCKIDELLGGGAAGGTAAGIHAFFNAKLTPGFDLLASLLDLEKEIKKADLILTAEGKIDAQSLQGKVPVSVARLAKKHLIACIGLVGKIEGELSPLYRAGFSGIFSIQNGPMTLEESMAQSEELLEKSAAQVVTYHQNICRI
ncbi:MAG: glycerate kinase [Flavobacteriaceae bacterium]